MPNYVTNRLVFSPDHARAVIDACCPDGQTVDFRTLVPMPPHLYLGNLSALDDEDFPLNWLTWCKANWGTKWNASRGSNGTLEDGRVFAQFDTAWSVPYPIICAVANLFLVPFEHRYCDEFSNFWGVELWGANQSSDGIVRIEKRKNDPADEKILESELLRCRS